MQKDSQFLQNEAEQLLSKQKKLKTQKDTQKQQNIKSGTNTQNSQFKNLIIQMMKKIKKNSPLFKPIKKLKSSISIIGGQDKASFYQSTQNLVIFHFGLGNQIDKQIIVNGTTLKNQQIKLNLAKQFIILPGKAFSLIQFNSKQTSERFIKQNQFINLFLELNSKENQKNEQHKISLQKQEKQQLNRPLFYFKQIQWKNLSRLMLIFYLKTNGINQQSQQNSFINIPNCPSIYQQSNNLPGLYLIDQFITKEQQYYLLNWIDSQLWQKLSNRRVQHYGYEFKYGKNQIDKDQQYQHKMPETFDFLLKKLSKIISQFSGSEIVYDQLTINDYFAGHGIPAHFDTHSPFQQYFVALSMLSGIVMDWKKYDGTQKSTYLKQRSLVVFSGQARYAWLHSIACRKLDKIDNQLKHRSRRISLTFRKIKRTPCKCKYYFYCDSQGYNQQAMKKNNPLLTKYLCEQNQKKLKQISSQKIYKQYVIKAYNSFGYDFHNKVIPQIKQYLQLESKQIQKQSSNSIILDIGCGNGQYKKYLISGKFYYIGIERCQIMIPVEEQMHMDGLRLAFKQQTFDIVLIIAVLHHFTNQNDRLKCLLQTKRVLKQQGVIYLTVFNFEGKKQEYPIQDILLDYCLPTHKVINQKEKQNQSLQQKLPVFPQNLLKQQGKITTKGQIFTRYYHLFKQQELINLVTKSGLNIQQLKKSKQNLIVKLNKKLK